MAQEKRLLAARADTERLATNEAAARWREADEGSRLTTNESAAWSPQAFKGN